MEKVLLVHGMFMNAFLMSPFVKWLQSAGYEVKVFGYPLIPNVQDITTTFVKEVNSFCPAIIVAHSLGGTITVHNLRQFPSVKKVVCLGSPLNGSFLGRAFAQGKTPWIIPESIRLIATEGVVIPSGTSVEVGMIAGTKDAPNLFKLVGLLGLFGLLPNLKDSASLKKLPENDGVVLVSETQVKENVPHTKVFTSHTGLVFSHDVYEQTLNFLKESKFKVKSLRYD